MAFIPITTRLPDWMDREIRGYWERQGVKPSPGYRRTIEEWGVSANLPLLEFREGVSGRRMLCSVNFRLFKIPPFV